MNIDFKRRKELLKERIEETKNILDINQVLRQYNWQFINPYLTGGLLYYFKDLHAKNTLTEEIVKDTFIKDFYRLNWTICYIDGYFVRSKYIQPFNYYIEYSLILCFQQDYAAAINILIPAFEGILSKYLFEAKTIEPLNDGRYKKIKKVIKYLYKDLIEKKIEWINGLHNYNLQQRNYIIELEKKYTANWFSILDDFIKDSLFAHTTNLPEGNLLNRHTILHQLRIERYHTFENYIKLFNALKFLSWIFLQIEGQSLLNNIDSEVYHRKRILYEEIIKLTNESTVYKHSILRDYELHDKKQYGYMKVIEDGMTDLQKATISKSRNKYIQESLKDLDRKSIV